MRYELNNGQKNIISEALKWRNQGNEQVFQYSGGPGTGKSVVLGAIIEKFGIPLRRVAPMSYVGAAAINMRLKGMYNARTIHSWLYRPVNNIKLDNDKNNIMNTYFDRPVFDIEFEPKPLDGIDLIVIDEAGEVPLKFKTEIEKRGIPIIAVGDIDQLPPVGDEPAYLTSGKIHILTEIMRQSENSAIPFLAKRLLQGLPLCPGYYGDVLVIYEDELTNDMVRNAQVMICGKNVTKDEMNTKIRKEILGIDYDLPIHGERVICRQNNWNKEVDGINLANGLMGTVVNNPDVGSFDGKNFRMDFKPDMMNLFFDNLLCDYQYFISPEHIRKQLKNNKYNRAEKFQFAYCISTHLAQGSTYNNGIYIQEYVHKDINKSLNYTGLTRFANQAIYVIPRSKRFY